MQPQPPQWSPPQAPSPQWSPQPMPRPDQDDEDLRALSPMLCKVAGGALALTGLFAVLASGQTWLTVEIRGPMMVAPYAIFLLGIACIVAGAKLAGARRWAAVVGLVAVGLLVVVGGGWFVYAFIHRFVAFFVMLTPGAAVAAVVLAAIALPACDRAERARARLSAKGIDLGL